MKYTRIAFCGAGGTGKTTLATWLAEFLGLPLNPVGSRSVAKSMGFDNPYDVDKARRPTYEHALKAGRTVEEAASAAILMNLNAAGPTMREVFQHRLQAEKVKWELEHDAFVSDRSTVDDFVYCAMHRPYSLNTPYLNRARDHLQRYDVIFFTSIDAFHHVGDDPSRLKEVAYHETFELFCDGALVNWLGNDWNEKVKHITRGALLRRQDQVAEYLGLDLDGNPA